MPNILWHPLNKTRCITLMKIFAHQNLLADAFVTNPSSCHHVNSNHVCIVTWINHQLRGKMLMSLLSLWMCADQPTWSPGTGLALPSWLWPGTLRPLAKPTCTAASSRFSTPSRPTMCGQRTWTCASTSPWNWVSNTQGIYSRLLDSLKMSIIFCLNVFCSICR